MGKRQAELIQKVRESGGRINFHMLALAMFPQEKYPRAFEYSSNGGPPGCYMALKNMVNKSGLLFYSNGATCRADVVLPSSMRAQAGEGGAQ